MKFHAITGQSAVMVKAETVEECGLMYWLSQRFKGQVVTLQFDTTELNAKPDYPMLWVKPAVGKDADGK